MAEVFQSNSGAWAYEISEDQLSCSKEVFHLLNLPNDTDAFTLEDLKNLLSKQDREVFSTSITQAIRQQGTFQLDIKLWGGEKPEKQFHIKAGYLEVDGNATLVGSITDITFQTEESQRLKLLESVITHTSDAVVITEAEPLHSPGPRIIYVNEAFTQMTGYTSKEIVGQTPRILQGPKTNQNELKKLSKALHQWKPCDITLLNYKKNGEEFWLNLSIKPVANAQGKYTHWIAIERDVTREQQKLLQNELFSQIGNIFNDNKDLKTCLNLLVRHLGTFGSFAFSELWLPDQEQVGLHLLAKYSTNARGKSFYQKSKRINYFRSGEGLPGKVWETGNLLLWESLGDKEVFIRREAAKASDMFEALGLPLFDKEDFVGVLVVGTDLTQKELQSFSGLLDKVKKFIGTEIKRKKLEEEMQQIFQMSKDIICILGKDGYFKRINGAATEILGYSKNQLLKKPFLDLIHPEDLTMTQEVFQKLQEGQDIVNFEHRMMHSNGEIKWISWTARPSPLPNGGLSFKIGRDITVTKKISTLLHDATHLARIGSWEIDVLKGIIYWSSITKQIHEVPHDFVPELEKGIQFYHPDYRAIVEDKVNQAIEKGIPFDFEALLVTAKGKELWVRAIGKPQMVEGKCLRVFGSFQDIHERKEAQQRIKSLADNLPGVIFKYGIRKDGSEYVDFVSEGSKAIWGLSPEECQADVSLIWKQIEAGGSLPIVKASIEESLKTMTPWQASMRNIMPSGREIWSEGHGKPRKLANGTIEWDSMLMDVTEKVELDELLTRASKLAKVGSWELDLTQEASGYMFWSPMTKHIFEVDEHFTTSLEESFSFYEPSSRALLQNAIEQLIQEGVTFDLELEAITENKQHKWIRCIGDAEWYQNECVKIFGSFQDIEERKTIENKLLHALGQVESILESIGDAFFAVDKNWTVTYWNKQAEKILQKPRTDVLRKNLWEEYSEAIDTPFYTNYHEAMATRERKDFEAYFEPLNLWVDVSAYPSEEGLSIYFRDITHRKTAEKNLQEWNERFELVLKASNDAIWDYNLKTEQMIWGSGFEELFGIDLTTTSPSLEAWKSRIHPEDRHRIITQLTKALNDSERQNWYEEYRYLSTHEKYAYVVDKGLIVRDKDGNPERIVSAISDITSQKTYEASLENLNIELKENAKQLKKSNEELEKFAFVASHDLQEPLRMITGFLSQLKTKYEPQIDERGQQYIHFATDGAKRLQLIIKDLLDYSRASKFEDQKVAVNLKEIIQNYEVLRQQVIHEKKVNLIYKKLPTLKGFKTPLVQTMHCLLDNAIKYAKENVTPQIEISVQEGKKEWLFAIKDNGIGIKKEYFDKIFIIFQRLHSRTEYSGTGMGLALVKKQVEAWGGKVWVDSEFNVGSTFYFTLPK